MTIQASTINGLHLPASVQANEAIIGSPMQRCVNKITKAALLILAPVAAFVFLPHPIGYFALTISVIFLFNEFCCAKDVSQDNTRSRVDEEARRVQDIIRSLRPYPERITDPYITTHRLRRYPSSSSILNSHVPVSGGLVDQRERARIPTSISDPQITSLAAHIPAGGRPIQQRPHSRADLARTEQPAPARNTGMHVSVGSRSLAAAQPITQLPQAQVLRRSSTIFIPPVAPRDEREHVGVGSRQPNFSDSID